MMDGLNLAYTATDAEAWVRRLNESWKLKGWSAVRLATESGVPKHSVYKYLPGKVKQPRGDTLERFADALGVSRLWLREGIGPQFNKLPIVGYVGAGEAIIFTDTFAAFNELRPSVEEMGQAIANVTSHEIGHLLGLIHTTDEIGIMDVTGSLRDLLGDQTFRRSPIYSAVFPIGAQDAVQSLMASVGGDPLMQSMKYVTYDAPAIESEPPRSEPSARSQLLLSSCGLDNH